MTDAFCTDCKRHTEVVFDHSAGDTVCSECGLVLESHSIDETSEWRTFANESGDNDPVRVGGPTNPLLADGGLSTVIAKPNGASGEFLSSSLGRWQNRGSNPDRGLILAFKTIATMSDRLGLVATIKDRANEIYKRVEDQKSSRVHLEREIDREREREREKVRAKSEEIKSMETSEAYPMNGGDGLHGYAKNSTLQGRIIDVCKAVAKEAIVEKLDMGVLDSSETFIIADLGCSVGPNTFTAVENIIEAVKSKYQSKGLNSKIPEFQVFFNDHVSNDFNLLFSSLPQDQRYYAAGSPGSFHGRVFPKASLHIVHSSYALQWLSGLPKEIVNKNCPAWYKGKVHYGNSGDQVIQAYKAQYETDMNKFLQARAQEVVCGGLMLLIFPFIPNGIHPSQSASHLSMDLVGYSLLDLAEKGIVSEEKVDSFNLPLYATTPQEFEAVVERNGGFSIERMEILPRSEFVNGNCPNGHQIATHMRAGFEGMIKRHFGEDIIDELFDLYAKKADEILIPAMVKSAEQGVNLFVVLKRKA